MSCAARRKERVWQTAPQPQLTPGKNKAHLFIIEKLIIRSKPHIFHLRCFSDVKTISKGSNAMEKNYIKSHRRRRRSHFNYRWNTLVVPEMVLMKKEIDLNKIYTNDFLCFCINVKYKTSLILVIALKHCFGSDVDAGFWIFFWPCWSNKNY